MTNDIFIQIGKIELPDIGEAIWRILKECNDEFVPPLSARDSTVSKNLRNEKSIISNEPTAYFETLKKQKLLVAINKNQIIGFMSFINRYTFSDLKGIEPSNYITTICVEKKHREKGVSSLLYEAVFYRLPHELKCDVVSSRTWSTNSKHIKLLQKLGFMIVHRVEDDRGAGIATVYWAKRIDA